MIGTSISSPAYSLGNFALGRQVGVVKRSSILLNTVTELSCTACSRMEMKRWLPLSSSAEYERQVYLFQRYQFRARSCDGGIPQSSARSVREPMETGPSGRLFRTASSGRSDLVIALAGGCCRGRAGASTLAAATGSTVGAVGSILAWVLVRWWMRDWAAEAFRFGRKSESTTANQYSTTIGF